MNNKTKKIAILGTSGMLGSAVLDVFYQDSNSFDIIATARNESLFAKEKYPNVNWQILNWDSFNIEKDITEILEPILNEADYVINCIGTIKPYIKDSNSQEVQNAIKVNSLFPHILSNVAGKTNCKVIQIATDCVYSGKEGNYTESSGYDALDVYGKTKNLGEIKQDNFYNLRCSIIGREKKSFISLLEWFLKQPKNASVNGFTNHDWNGVTTHHFGKLCLGIIKNDLDLPHLQHIVPANKIKKSAMLKAFAKAFNRQDIVINDVEAPQIIDRTLATQNNDINQKIWQLAGYDTVPTVEKMIEEISAI